jgi:two-component system alkaline phosphatase synthesis response regulator PhoP
MARILVIDDERGVTHALRLLLEGRGHAVLVADDGSRGLAVAQRQSPDAIILDLMMPLMDGFAVLEALREDERTAAIPVMILSALRNESVVQRCYALGAKTYFRKPFDGDHLIGAVEELASSVVDQIPGTLDTEPRAISRTAELAWRQGS